MNVDELHIRTATEEDAVKDVVGYLYDMAGLSLEHRAAVEVKVMFWCRLFERKGQLKLMDAVAMVEFPKLLDEWPGNLENRN